MALELRLLGPFAAIYDGRPLNTFRSNKTQALLAYLATEQGFANAEKDQPPVHQRDHLMTLLWPRTPQKSAQVNLRQSLYQLRQAVPEVAGPGAASGADREPVPFLLSDRQTVQVNPDARYHLDVTGFLRLVMGDPAPDELAEAAALYGGPFLSDFHLPDSETFEEWAAARRATLQRMALEALETLAEHHLERAQPEEAERHARRQLALDELRERGHRQLLRALAQKGERNAALAHYDDYCALLEEELGVEPSAEIEAIYEAVREGQGEVASVPAPDVRPQPQTRKKPPLPAPATPFVGRQREMAEITGMLKDGCRLLTLLGPGGSGKTRLAIEVARRHADEYAHGAAFVDLAPLSDPANIPTAIATAVGFHFTGKGSPRQQILNYLANKEMLLVLDNVEHLLDPHRPDGAELVYDLLQAAPDVSVLATSRARLHLGAEYMYEVGGLSVKEGGFQEGESEAAEMFMEHARRVQPGFALEEAGKRAVARICRLVEGMPLAIELAASWVRYLPPAEIARKLAEDLDFLESNRTDLPERQRSMRAAFGHSWNLLAEDDRQALMKLSMFRGGASRRAAAAVTGASLHTLVELSDHSLLTLDPDSGRFAVHELIRQFAEERLEESGQADAARDAHSDYYLQDLAERLPDLKGRDQLGALDAIEEDFENVRVASEWAIEQGQWQHFPQAAQSLYLFALFRNRYLDGIKLFEAACHVLAMPATKNERRARAYTLAAGEGLRSWLGLQEKTEALAAVPELRAAAETLADPAAVAYCRLMVGQILSYDIETRSEAIAELEAAVSYYRQAHDPFYWALVLWRLNYAHSRVGPHEEVRDFARRGLALAREIGDRFIAAALLHNLGVGTRGPTEVRERYFREAADLHREIGAQADYAFSLAHLAADSLKYDGDLANSRSMLEEALTIAAEQNQILVYAYILVELATHRLLEAQYEKVLAMTEEARALVGEYRWSWCWATFLRGVASFAVGDLDDALPLLKRGLSAIMDRDWPDNLRTYLEYTGSVLAWKGEREWAAELLALGLTDNYHRPMLEIDPLLARTRAELEEILGDEVFAAAWERGKDLDPLTAAEDVLEALEEMEAAG